ncbi:hypothetical protein FWK35_00034412, partial [Aphis craccivora]
YYTDNEKLSYVIKNLTIINYNLNDLSINRVNIVNKLGNVKFLSFNTIFKNVQTQIIQMLKDFLISQNLKLITIECSL